MIRNREYEKAVNKLIHIAEDFADVQNSRVKHSDRVAEGDGWNKKYFAKMDSLCAEIGLRKGRNR